MGTKPADFSEERKAHLAKPRNSHRHIPGPDRLTLQGQPMLPSAEELGKLSTSGNQPVDKNKMDSSNWAEFGATSQELQRHLPSQAWETKSSWLKSACGTAWVSVSIAGSCPQILLPSQIPATCTWDSSTLPGLRALVPLLPGGSAADGHLLPGGHGSCSRSC